MDHERWLRLVQAERRATCDRRPPRETSSSRAPPGLRSVDSQAAAAHWIMFGERVPARRGRPLQELHQAVDLIVVAAVRKAQKLPAERLEPGRACRDEVVAGLQPRRLGFK